MEKIKRTARALVPVTVAGLISWPFGFPPIPVLFGAVLSIITYYGWEPGYAAGEKVYRAIQDFRVGVRITEEKMPPPTPRPPAPRTAPSEDREREERVRPDAPTVPMTDHLVPEPTRDVGQMVQGFMVGTGVTGKPVYMPRLTSVWVAGVGGSGKTVDVVGLVTQTVPMYKGNVRIAVIDPHMHTPSPDSLVARLSPLSPFYLKIPGLSNPVSGGSAALELIRCLDGELMRRKAGGDSSQAIVVVVDEVTDLFDDPEISGPLRALLLKINEQARKVHIFAIIASQQLKSSRIQGTELRNTVATFLLHNMPPALARQVVPEEYAAEAFRLAVGKAIYSSMGQAEVVTIQDISTEEIASRIAPYLPLSTEMVAGYSGDNTVDVPATEIVQGELVPPEPGIAEVMAIWETYMILNKDLSYSEDSAIRALAIDVYGPEDPNREEKVRRALKLGEEHL